jgi:hypothetical protein
MELAVLQKALIRPKTKASGKLSAPVLEHTDGGACKACKPCNK